MSEPVIASARPASRESAASGSILVRVADLEDRAQVHAVVDLLDAYARDPLGAGTALSVSIRQRLIEGLRAFPGALILLAWQRDRPVGLAVCFPSFSTFRAAPVLNIHDLAVMPSARRLGIATRLLAAVEDEARSRGCCKVTLEVRDDNGPARSLYERAGYGAACSGGEPVQYLFLEKRLETER